LVITKAVSARMTSLGSPDSPEQIPCSPSRSALRTASCDALIRAVMRRDLEQRRVPRERDGQEVKFSSKPKRFA
jgi:hypothetical protein